MPNLDHIIVKENLIKQHRVIRHDVSWTPCFRIFDEDEDNIETDSTPPTLVSKTYKEVVLEQTPIHYWRLDETSTASPADDIGSGNNDGTYSAGVGLEQAPAIVGDDDPGTAAQFADTTDFVSLVDHDIGTVGEEYKNLTVEFWVKVPSLAQNSSQAIFGKKTTGTTSEGKKNEFLISIGSYNHVVVNGIIPSSSLYLECYAYCPELPRPTALTENLGKNYRVFTDISAYLNQYIHVAYLIDNGHRRLYINGKLVHWSRWSNPIKKTSGELFAGYLGSSFGNWWESEVLKDVNSNPIPITMDEIAMYDKALSDSEIRRHYLIGRNFYNENISAGEGGGGDGGGAGDTDDCDNNVLPELSVGTDITEHILEYSIEYNTDQLVESCTLMVAEDWPFEELKQKLRSNTYITIEERYRSFDGEQDSGWFPVGHFLVDGPYAKDVTANGQKVYRVTCRGLLKLTTFDKVNRWVTPDIILVPRTELSLITTTLETYEYQKARPGTTSEFYENWTETPNIKLWVSDFTTTDDIVNGSTDPIRIRGAENSLQVVGGSGKVVFDKEFFQSKVQDNGLGYPSTVEAEWYRYATHLDIALVDLVGATTTLSGGEVVSAFFEVNDPRSSIDLNTDYIGRSLLIKSGGASGRIFKITDITLGVSGDYAIYVLDEYGKLPDLSGFALANGDQIQLTDANLIEDAIAKILFRAGFQNEDATKPFYFELDAPPTPVLVPPVRYEVSDGLTWSELLTEILEFAPPNYKLYTDEDGVTRTTLIVQKPVELGVYDHEITKIFDISQDRDDFGIYTRVLANGRATTSTNVGLLTDVGGFSAVGAYKLDNFYNGDTDSSGTTKTQSAADAVMEQIPNGDPKTPNLSSNGDKNYGILYNIGNSSAQRWTMEDSDFMWMDIGTALDGREYLIDYLQFTVLPPYKDGSVLNQTMYVYYMTEDDYINATGHVPPTTADDATVRTNMLTLKNSSAWKLLVDEFKCEDGQTNINSDEFVYERPLRLRFLKFRVGQPYFRFKGGSYGKNISRIVLSDVKVWTSMKIIQMAKLGYTPPFDSQEHKDLFARLRQRTFVLDENLYLDSALKAKNFAIRELQERYTEFSPWGINCFAPAVRLHQTIRFRNPDTGEVQHLLVRRLQRSSDATSCNCLIQGSDYLTFEVQ